MNPPKLRLRIEGDVRTRCGRPGCPGSIGVLAWPPGDAGRRHLLLTGWQVEPRNAADDAPVWRLRHAARWARAGEQGKEARYVSAADPDAVIECPKCQTIQRLPDDVQRRLVDKTPSG